MVKLIYDKLYEHIVNRFFYLFNPEIRMEICNKNNLESFLKKTGQIKGLITIKVFNRQINNLKNDNRQPLIMANDLRKHINLSFLNNIINI
jgi:hypothetical protein